VYVLIVSKITHHTALMSVAVFLWAWLSGFAMASPPPLMQSAMGEGFFEEGIATAPSFRDTFTRSAFSTMFYDHGDPTPYEQYMLELVNRARANPGAEAALHGIDLNTGFPPGTFEDVPRQPLAMHRFLLDAARDHALWMLDNDIFSHTGVGGSSSTDRMNAAGYVLEGIWGAGENISWTGINPPFPVEPVSFTESRHTSLFISTNHRVNILYELFDEVGIGIHEGQFTDGNNDTWNALMVTQDYGLTDYTPSPFLLGAAYYDFNGNHFYDPGEGFGGVHVEAQDASYHTETASEGGYTLPIPTNAGTHTVTFSGFDFTFSTNVSFPGDENIKVDFIPAYQPPSVIGPTSIWTGATNQFGSSTVIGATDYAFALQTANPAMPDSAESLNRMEDGTSPDYTPLSTAVYHSADTAYHLTHPDFEIQTLTYLHSFYVQSNATLQFYSRLRWATEDQFAAVELSSNKGTSWTSVHHQAGTDDSGETSFTLHTIELDAFEGQEIQIRFIYDSTNSYYLGTEDDLGWFIDTISFSNMLEIATLSNTVVASGGMLTWTPDTPGEYRLQITPWHDAKDWPQGPPHEITVTSPPTYSDWATAMEALHSLPPGALSSPEDDYNSDGVKNVMAYKLGLDPTVTALSHDLPAFRDGEPVFDYWFDTHAPDVAIIIELTVDMETWYDINDPLNPVTVTDTFSHTEGTLEHRSLHIQSDTHKNIAVRIRLELN